MLTTIINKIGNDVQLWTVEIDESDLVALMEKYGHKGESVLVDADELHDEIKEYYK